jgi:hypothetical protein
LLRVISSIYHRSINKWYLRKGNKRVLIDKNLDKATEEIHKVLEDLKRRREAVKRELIRRVIKLRTPRATIEEVVEVTGVSTSALYRYL